jgi:hypothetical protein
MVGMVGEEQGQPYGTEELALWAGKAQQVRVFCIRYTSH